MANINKKQFKNGTMIMGFSQKAFVFNKEGKFLVMRRTKTAPARPLYWDLPGGDVEYREEPRRSMLREIKEETGLSVKELLPFDIWSGIDPSENYWITVAYRASGLKGKLKISWEHDLYKWVTLDEFLKLKSGNRLRKFALNLRKQAKI